MQAIVFLGFFGDVPKIRKICHFMQLEISNCCSHNFHWSPSNLYENMVIMVN